MNITTLGREAEAEGRTNGAAARNERREIIFQTRDASPVFRRRTTLRRPTALHFRRGPARTRRDLRRTVRYARSATTMRCGEPPGSPACPGKLPAARRN